MTILSATTSDEVIHSLDRQLLYVLNVTYRLFSYSLNCNWHWPLGREIKNNLWQQKAVMGKNIKSIKQ